MCVGQEFTSRENGLPGRLEECNLGSVFATDGKIAPNNLRILEDDEMFFAVYDAALNVRSEALEQAPALPDLFDPLAESLDTETMQQLDTAVDQDGELPEDVSRQYLEDNGFIGG